MNYNPCQKYWQLFQTLSPSQPENAVFNAVLNVTVSADRSGISFFVVSRRVLPSYLSLPLISFYVSIVYVVSKLFRQIFVPVTSEIFITDATDPDDILMLCETIHLYRLKQMLTEEEELFFLLIDIMRSPHIFKAICGDSIKKPVIQDDIESVMSQQSPGLPEAASLPALARKKTNSFMDKLKGLGSKNSF